MVEKITGLGEHKVGVLYHHERWDGKGYPAQLKGDDIPLDARVLAIADELDAMTSTRTYRSALPFEAAYERLKENRGTQFDPHIIAALDSCKEILYEIYMESHNEMMEFE